MDAYDALDDLTGEERMADHRARAATMLAEISRRAKEALTEQGIDLNVFFVVPSSGDSIITCGAMSDPPDDLWGQVSTMISSIVEQAVGLDRTRLREVRCATT